MPDTLISFTSEINFITYGMSHLRKCNRLIAFSQSHTHTHMSHQRHYNQRYVRGKKSLQVLKDQGLTP